MRQKLRLYQAPKNLEGPRTYEDLENAHLKEDDDIENQSIANLDEHLGNEDEDLNAMNLSTAISKDFIMKWKHRSK